MMSFFYTNKKLFKKLHTMIYFITIYIYIISKNTNVIKGDKFFFFLIFPIYGYMYVHVLLSFFLARTNIYIYCNPVTYVKKNGQYFWIDRSIDRYDR